MSESAPNRQPKASGAMIKVESKTDPNSHPWLGHIADNVELGAVVLIIR